MSPLNLACLVCEEPIAGYLTGNPQHAVMMTSDGSDGSHIFAPTAAHQLRVYVCDDCLEAKAASGLIHLTKNVTRVAGFRPGLQLGPFG